MGLSIVEYSVTWTATPLLREGGGKKQKKKQNTGPQAIRLFVARPCIYTGLHLTQIKSNYKILPQPGPWENFKIELYLLSQLILVADIWELVSASKDFQLLETAKQLSGKVWEPLTQTISYSKSHFVTMIA